MDSGLLASLGPGMTKAFTLKPVVMDSGLAPPARPGMTAARYPAALISRSAALRASSVISAPASMRAISSRRRSAASSLTLVATRFPRASASLVIR
jgi:hypothetical protein